MASLLRCGVPPGALSCGSPYTVNAHWDGSEDLSEVQAQHRTWDTVMVPMPGNCFLRKDPFCLAQAYFHKIGDRQKLFVPSGYRMAKVRDRLQSLAKVVSTPLPHPESNPGTETPLHVKVRNVNVKRSFLSYRDLR